MSVIFSLKDKRKLFLSNSYHELILKSYCSVFQHMFRARCLQKVQVLWEITMSQSLRL